MSKDKYFQRLQNVVVSKNGILQETAFITAKTKYHITCEHGHLFKMTYDKLTGRGDWCPYCAGRYGDFQEKYRNIIENVHHGKMLSNYVNGSTAIKCECENGHIFYPAPHNLLKGRWCGVCNASRGEECIKRYLDSNKVSYKTEYTFPDLKGDRQCLPFDFAVFKDNHLIYLIEFDGEQHFRPMRHSHRYEENLNKFLQTQKHDLMKNDYCIKNNIPLLRIAYFDVRYNNLKHMQEDINNLLTCELFFYL